MARANILILSDMHVGNRLAILHPNTPGCKLDNAGQKYLWQCWQHMMRAIPKKLDALILLDEVLDGPAKPNDKYMTIITPPSDQRKAARLLLEPLVKRAGETWCVVGSGWHVNARGEATEVLASEMGAQEWPDGKRSGYYLLLKTGQVVLDFAHSQSVTMINRGMPLERELRHRLIDNPLPDRMDGELRCIVRGHTHVFAFFADRHGMSIGCPGWQLPYYDFGYAKASVGRARVDLGWVLLQVDLTTGMVQPRWELYPLLEERVWDLEGGKWWTSPSLLSRRKTSSLKSVPA